MSEWSDLLSDLARRRAKRFNPNATRGNTADYEEVQAILLDLIGEVGGHVLVSVKEGETVNTYNHLQNLLPDEEHKPLTREYVYWSSTWITENGDKLVFNFPSYVLKGTPAIRHTVYKSLVPEQADLDRA